MKRINNNIITGFPESYESWKFISEQNLQLGSLISELASNDNCILTGCKITQTATEVMVSSGEICYNNRIYSVIGATFTIANINDIKVSFSTVTATTYPNPTFLNESSPRQIYVNDIGALSVATGVLLSSFKRVPKLTDSQFPIGMITMWSGAIADIPSGWELYQPLKGKFVVGYDPANADYENIGNTGGEDTVQLTVNQLPKHTADFSGDTAETDDLDGMWVGNDGGGFPDGSGDTTTAGWIRAYVRNSRWFNFKIPALSFTGQTSEVGNDEAHENRPPYYTVAYIVYVG